MTADISLSDYAENARQEVLAMISVENSEFIASEAFLKIVLDNFAESGEIEDYQLVYHKGRGMEISGYALDDDLGTLDVFLGIWSNSEKTERLAREHSTAALRRMRAFTERALEGLHNDLEESSPAHEMAAHIHEIKNRITRLRFYLITNNEIGSRDFVVEPVKGIEVGLEIWDIVRLHRFETQGAQRQSVMIDLKERFGRGIQCLTTRTGNNYRVFFALFPGEYLRSIYRDHTSRLLERNVRSFLQARGNVNKGIRDTILNEPSKFLAYNNGITITSESVILEEDLSEIITLEGMQIVNGAQTTASLLAANDGKADLSEIYISAKIIEIQNGEYHDSLVQEITKYANAQNKVQDADFRANDPFHVKLEQFSRTTWAKLPGSSHDTHWFYERARGDYVNAKLNSGTAAGMRLFTAQNPTRQKFVKTDVAKYELAWAQLPYIVSLGTQKCFSHFTGVYQPDHIQALPDEKYFKNLIGKAILFRSIDKLVWKHLGGSYKANVVAYTVAYLSLATEARLDFKKIWDNQNLSDNLENVCISIASNIKELLIKEAGSANISEFAKKPTLWNMLKSKKTVTSIRERLSEDMLSLSSARDQKKIAANIKEMDPVYIKNAELITSKFDNAECWRKLKKWGQQVRTLNADQIRACGNIAAFYAHGGTIRPRDAQFAVEAITRADELGFDPMGAS